MTDSALSTAADRDLYAWIADLKLAVEFILRQKPQGMTELALIRILQAEPWSLLDRISFSDSSQLYPVHFILFHVLYQLRDDLAEHDVTVEISPLLIRLELSGTDRKQDFPAAPDPLRAFYLDLTQFKVPKEDIRRMMEDFWRGAGQFQVEPGELEGAAEKLGFQSLPCDFAEVRQRFRRLVMKEHPDRGGDTERVQHLNIAYSVLRQHYRQISR